MIPFLEAANIALLLGILAAYWQNWRQLKAPFTAGLIVFVGLFLLQNLLGLWLGAMGMMYFAPAVEPYAALLTGLQTVGFAVLLWITWRT